MRLSGYGLGTASQGEVHLLGDVPLDVRGRTVLLVDDIIDSGHSLTYAKAEQLYRIVGHGGCGSA